jgi:DNA polymerase-3 subunit delta
MDSLSFLERAGKKPPLPVYIVHGDEDFLKRQVVQTLRKIVLGGEEGDFGLTTLEGDETTLAEVRDELHTLPLLGNSRLVVIENADPFVTEYRAALEELVTEKPARGVLVLLVASWPSTTRLAKLLGSDASIVCKAPPVSRLAQWCVSWAAARHGKELTPAAARLLLDLAGSAMGQLEQELAKLASYVGEARSIDEADVDRLVGNSQAQNTWKILDAITGGQPGQGLAILDRLLEQGEDPIRILGAFSFQLRRLAQASRLAQQGHPLPVAIEMAGIQDFNRWRAEKQLRHLGDRRANRLYNWLLETDLGLKGSSQLPPRTQLERLLVRMARRNG